MFIEAMSEVPTSSRQFLQEAQGYDHSEQQRLRLKPYHDGLIEFRARYASYETITKRLNKGGVKVSLTTVRRYCQLYESEINERRALIKESPESKPTSSPAQVQSENEKPDKTTGQVALPSQRKRGPRIARDDF